ncbi:MAG: zinc ABC transporter substrate-binding protein [Anaplasmataceae bacterium]|nr:zinc ABC transporter substrate-binding protein [Anaplasmataceae bacterium]
MKKKFYSFTTYLLCTLLLASCQKADSSHTPTPKILVSIAPYQYFVDRIAGDTVEVVCLVPKGTNPHLYETPPRLIEDALQASLWFKLGEPGEEKFVDLFKTKSAMRIVSLTDGLDLIEDSCTCAHQHNHEAQDLHVWLSVHLAEQQVLSIFKELCSAFPQHATLYAERLQKLNHDLHTLDKEISALLDSNPTQAVLLSHPSLGYFCRDYHIEQLSIEIEGKEPLPNSLIQLLDDAKNKNIRKILLQPQHETRGAERIAKELGLPLESIDPYGDDYFFSMRQIAQAIAS